MGEASHPGPAANTSGGASAGQGANNVFGIDIASMLRELITNLLRELLGEVFRDLQLGTLVTDALEEGGQGQEPTRGRSQRRMRSTASSVGRQPRSGGDGAKKEEDKNRSHRIVYILSIGSLGTQKSCPNSAGN